jgi:hypothetical protein
MSTTTWVSGINAATGLTTDGTYIYVSTSDDNGGYGVHIHSYQISNTNTTTDLELQGGVSGTGVLAIDSNYLYGSYVYNLYGTVGLVTYPTMVKSDISLIFNSYDSNPDNPGSFVYPDPSGIVVAGGYLYASFGNGFLGRVSLTNLQSGDNYNDPDFGPSAFTPYYNLAGYNDLNGSLTSNIPNGLATDTTYLYIACSTGKIIQMTLAGASGASVTVYELTITGGSLSSLTGLTISSDYQYFYALSSSASTITKIQLTPSPTGGSGLIISTYSLGSSYIGGLRNGIVSNSSYLYAAYYGSSSTSNNGSILRYGAGGPSDVPCFGENTKILCFNRKTSKEEYVLIQNIRPETLVKTSLNGYRRVDMIGKTTIQSYANKDRIKNRLYKCTKEKYPEIIDEDLILTGCHSILVDELTDEQKEKTIEEIKEIYTTDLKYRLFTFLDPRAEPYQVAGELPIYHIALENENYYMNYGIYANGLLVESCSKRYLKELSGMTLIE